MSHRPRIATFAAALLLVLAGSLPGCGSDPANPGGGGGALELDSGNIGPGGTYVHTFANAGTYNYHCNVHGLGMAGSVTVANGQPATESVTIVDNAYQPSSVSVAPGGTVTWTRTGSNSHTVTSH